MTAIVLVLGADNRQSAAIVRSLARAGYETVVGRERTQRSFIECSRYVGRVWEHPDPRETSAFNHVLLTALKNDEFRIVIPVGEKQLRALAHCQGLPTDRILGPDSATLLRCLDKRAAWQAAAEAGIPVPAQSIAATVDGLLHAARSAGFPCVIKPGSSNTEFLGYKALICEGAETLARLLDEWDGDCATLIVQQYVRGRRHNCNVIAHRGRLTHYCEVVVCRTDRPDGTGYCVDGITVPPTPALVEGCRRLLSSLDYSGPAGIQFLVDPVTGQRTFLEINPRFDAVVALPYHAGSDLPRFAVEQLLSPPPPRARAPHIEYRAGVRIHWLSGDVAGLLRAIRHRAVGAGAAARWAMSMLVSLLRPHHHILFDRRDPWPAVALTRRMLRAAVVPKARPRARDAGIGCGDRPTQRVQRS